MAQKKAKHNIASLYAQDQLSVPYTPCRLRTPQFVIESLMLGTEKVQDFLVLGQWILLLFMMAQVSECRPSETLRNILLNLSSKSELSRVLQQQGRAASTTFHLIKTAACIRRIIFVGLDYYCPILCESASIFLQPQS